MVGDSSVGKTSLIRRFVIDVFDDKYIATIGAKVSKRDVEYKMPEKTVYLTIMLWDILGQKDYKKMRIQGLTGAHGVVLVADMTRPETIKSMEEFWLPEVTEICPAAPALLLGNKTDLAGETGSAVKQMNDLANKAEIPVIFCSAKTGTNVEQAFRTIGEVMLSSDLGDKKQVGDLTEASLAQAIDDVVSDFCEQYGDTQRAMEIVEREFNKARVNVNSPSKDSLLMAIEYLSDIERDVHGRDVSEVNKLRRWKMIDEARSG